MKFLGNVLSTVVGIFVFLMVSFFGIIILGLIFGGGDDAVSVEKDSVLELNLSEITEDYAGKTNYKDINYFEAKHDGLIDILNAIDYAKTDENIKGISILNNYSMLGIAQTKALRDALEDFKKSGKFVLAYSDGFSQKEYYLNSVANTIYLNPVGDLDFKGLSAQYLFFKDFQEKTGLKMEVIRHGKFKSAVEPFLENKMSDANKEQTSALLTSLWNSIVNDIAISRKIPVQTLNEIANGLLARTPQMAKNVHLIDKIAYEDEYHNDIKTLLKIDKKEDYNVISISDYSNNVATTASGVLKTDKIAVIYAQGEINGGEGDVNIIGEGAMRRSLQDARKDENIKAIVLRVNSPGGSALTSELIWREIEITKKVKPVVVSMGNYAASGGYYISCNANRIFAEANTITGSIGVFGMLPNFNEAANRYGIHADQVKTHENASSYSPFVPLDDKYRAFTLEGVENIYNVFLQRVSKGRKLTIAQVDAIGQGRVWSGADAKKIGLVDDIGGLDAAIQYAAKITNTKDYGTVNFPEYEKDFKDMFKNLPFASSKTELIKEEIGNENYQILQKIKQLKARQGVQAILPYELEIK
ncbi:signal peptide peptidase SppA [Flavobacterium branchiophilum]|uniref:Protease IV (Signal peptide peptidase) n=1 Tax=Flavobacterium branchiophilum (strain FL-15) TaxID=1034807 RepID=G2Z170_FLABF|nr:signal peptide peptidase SppA [Flavobacterium branchiophilum]CCB69633.1 Protease IV (signal peptide peptidase) [Flavobacterium branchiophilum FL-15]